jgi:hypothetical protein
MVNPAGTQMRALAERLLAEEAAESSAGSGGPAAFRVCERLRRSLSMLAGAAGFQSLLARALTLARKESSGLDAVQVCPDGSLVDCKVALNTGDAEAEVLLVANLLALLFTFIGEALTMRLVYDAWPNASLESSIAKEERNA